MNTFPVMWKEFGHSNLEVLEGNSTSASLIRGTHFHGDMSAQKKSEKGRESGK